MKKAKFRAVKKHVHIYICNHENNDQICVNMKLGVVNN